MLTKYRAPSRRFQADDDLAVKQVRRIVDHEGKLTGLVFCHAARDHIRLVVELLNGVQHQLPRLFDMLREPFRT